MRRTSTGAVVGVMLLTLAACSTGDPDEATPGAGAEPAEEASEAAATPSDVASEAGGGGGAECHRPRKGTAKRAPF